MTKRRDQTFGFMTRAPGEAARPTGRAVEPAKVDDRAPEAIDQAHRDAVERGLRQSRRGAFASAADVKAAFRRFRP